MTVGATQYNIDLMRDLVSEEGLTPHELTQLQDLFQDPIPRHERRCIGLPDQVVLGQGKFFTDRFYRTCIWLATTGAMPPSPFLIHLAFVDALFGVGGPGSSFRLIQWLGWLLWRKDKMGEFPGECGVSLQAFHTEFLHRGFCIVWKHRVKRHPEAANLIQVLDSYVPSDNAAEDLISRYYRLARADGQGADPATEPEDRAHEAFLRILARYGPKPVPKIIDLYLSGRLGWEVSRQPHDVFLDDWRKEKGDHNKGEKGRAQLRKEFASDIEGSTYGHSPSSDEKIPAQGVLAQFNPEEIPGLSENELAQWKEYIRGYLNGEYRNDADFCRKNSISPNTFKSRKKKLHRLLLR